MSNSSLVNYVKISPNSNNPRKHKIDTITIHHMAGNLSVETCGAVFASSSRQASSNYGVGSDGRIGMYVEEKNRAWTSSNSANDHRAVTIEVANDGGAPNWHVSDKALEATIKLCVDICKRNDIERINFTGDKSGNLTMHKWFAATLCPGPYLESKFPYIAAEVNKRLGVAAETPKKEEVEAPKTETKNEMYRVRKSWTDAKSQKGAYKVLDYAKALADKNPGYSVYDSAGKCVYPEAQKTTEGYLVEVTANNMYVRKGPGLSYKTTTSVKKKEVFTIVEESNGWGKLKSGAGWIRLHYTKRL